MQVQHKSNIKCLDSLEQWFPTGSVAISLEGFFGRGNLKKVCISVDTKYINKTETVLDCS